MIYKAWGSPWTCQYTPQIAGEPVTPVSTSPAPAVYVFDRKPSELEARDGTNKIATGSGWSFDAATKIATFTIPKIDYPDDGRRIQEFWLSIVFALSTSGDLIYDVRPFWLTLPDGMDETPVPTAQQLVDEYWTQALIHYDAADIDNFIAKAAGSVKRDLKWIGKPWPRIENVGDLRDAIAYKALSKIFLDLMDDNADLWKDRFLEAKSDYKELIDAFVPVLSSVDNETGKNPESIPEVKTTFLLR